jgi:predicted dehydrogenase
MMQQLFPPGNTSSDATMINKTLSRRHILRAVPAAAVFSIVPAHVLAGGGATPPSEKLNIATIGLGWPGRKDTDALAGTNNIVALCDVDTRQSPEFRKKYATARQFQDARRMFDQMEKSIDAVIVAVPDHNHAVLSMAAMRRGKHVYCEKPLAHSIHEVRQLMKAARDYKVVTQLGNQGHSSGSIRDFCEWIWDGAIGNVHTIHAGAHAVNSGMDDLEKIKTSVPTPPEMDWDTWIGPAPMRPFNPAYHPFKWRGWTAFGNGTLGDWTCHVLDPVFWALDLGAPRTIQAEVPDYDPKAQADVYPKGEIVTFEFPAKGKRGPVTIKWHSGTQTIARPPQLEEGHKMIDTGAVVYGDKGVILYGSHGAGGVRIIPDTQMKAYKKPSPNLARVAGHELDWAAAIKEARKAGSDFSYGGPLTEIALLGVIAIKLAGRKLEWDADKMQFVNCPEADLHLNPPYRAGWSL